MYTATFESATNPSGITKDNDMSDIRAYISICLLLELIASPMHSGAISNLAPSRTPSRLILASPRAFSRLILVSYRTSSSRGRTADTYSRIARLEAAKTGRRLKEFIPPWELRFTDGFHLKHPSIKEDAIVLHDNVGDITLAPDV